MTRLPDWETRLLETVGQWRVRPFRWDRDCGRWAAACVMAQTGDDPLKDLRPLYRTKAAALRLLAEKPMEQRLDEMFPRIHPALAQRGDIVLTQEMCLGCIITGGEAMFYFENGMTMIPRAEWSAAWAVGRHG